VLSNFLPATFLAGIQKSLVSAGLTMSAITFVTFWAICIGFFSSLGLLAVAVLGGFSAQGLMGLMVMGGIGFLIPWMWLKSAVRSRQRIIVKALPDALDLVMTCVEAGLGLDAALGRVAEQMKALATEWADAGGISITPAQRSLRLGRTDVQELISFVNAIIQAEQLGVSIAQVLKVQSDQMRTRRRQKAEQLAHEAAIKMIFPLVLFIFPAFMVVIQGLQLSISVSGCSRGPGGDDDEARRATPRAAGTDGPEPSPTGRPCRGESRLIVPLSARR
jgi:tight adherence protein C